MHGLDPAIKIAFTFLEIAVCYWVMFELFFNLWHGLQGDIICHATFLTSTVMYKPFGPVFWVVLMTMCSKTYHHATLWQTDPKAQPVGV